MSTPDPNSTKSDSVDPDVDSDPNAIDRNPIESVASEVLESIRSNRSGANNPAAPLLASVTENLIAGQQLDPEHQSELQDLMPLIERLEKARMSHVQRPNGLASLGTDRPDRLGDYELVRQIGRGGMGVVFEAVQRSLGRRVAVKVLPKSLLVDETQLKRFQHEARTAASLHHTNIVPVFGVGQDNGFHYYVMQRIDGCGLDQIMSDINTHKLSVDQVAKLGFQAASALSHAHSQNILHRDIKPANLIVNDRNELWVTDFGVAKAIESDAMTRTGDVVGTLRYMPPEQLTGSTDVRSDIYSLGVTLYELLAGRPAMDDASIRSSIVSRRPAPMPPPLRTLNPDVPRDLETILHTAMLTDPDRRYQKADAMVDDLQRFIDGKSISVRPETLMQTAKRWSKRNPAIASLAALSLALLVGVAAISTAGYFGVQRALEKEQISRRSAEGTAELAVAALDEVFDRFASTDPAQRQFSSAPAISLETAEMLEGLLPYFDALAARGHSDSGLSEATLKARYAIGETHFQLGHYQSSIDKLEFALRDASENASIDALREAQIRNRIGYAHRMLNARNQANQQHQLALNQLQQLDDGDSAAQFELARTHFLIELQVNPGMHPTSMPSERALGISPTVRSGPPRGPGGQARPESRPGGPGPRQGSPRNDSHQQHLNQAIQILQRLLEKEPDNISYNVAYASCLRRIAGDSLSMRKQEQEFYHKAIDLLRTLDEKYPNEPSVQFELTSALSGFNVFQRLSQQENTEALQRCREAVQHCEVLVTAHPNVPSYNNTLVHSLFRLGILLDRMSEQEESGQEYDKEAEDVFERASRYQATLLRQHPDEVGYLAWYATMLMRYGEIALRVGNLEQCEEAMTTSARTWARLCDEYPDENICWMAAPYAFDLLADAQHSLGKQDAAKNTRADAEMRWMYWEMIPNGPSR